MRRLYEPKELEELARKVYENERKINHLNGWFIVKEIYENVMEERQEMPHVIRTAFALKEAVKKLPVYIDENNVFAGTQRDAFARSYALINPNFSVSTFNGYCDPTAVFDDIDIDENYTKDRINRVREQSKRGKYVTQLMKVYDEAKADTSEVVYFVEQVTGHLIPDMRDVLKYGVSHLIDKIDQKIEREKENKKRNQYIAMKITLESVLVLAEKYRNLALLMAEEIGGRRKEQFTYMAKTLLKVPRKGAENLYEAIQSFLLLWQVMCIEQAPNPFAFSVGNADRIFEPYRLMEKANRDYAAGLFKHFLVFFNVGDRSWAISQNVLIGGRDIDGNDLTNVCSYALLDAYYAMNFPQPILSLKLHKNTPDKLYEEIGKFLFTPGCLTPSFFNDDSIFEVLKKQGYEECDLQDYSIAGCQEPLIMGKDNGNTTNSWLNLGKILELTLNDGRSLLTGEKLGLSYQELAGTRDIKEILSNIRELFYKHTEYFVKRMVKAANGASVAISYLPVPYLSCFMGGIETGIDVRDTQNQGTKYNGSGCLIHGLSLVADSFVAIDALLEKHPDWVSRLILALQNNYEGEEELHQFLFHCEKFGNNQKTVDQETVEVATKITDIVRKQKNYLGNSFRPDYSTPSTHLIYGNWVGALPSGRKEKEMLSYGIDPLYGEAQHGLGFRILSVQKLLFENFNGGYASHIGLDPKYFLSNTMEKKGMEFKEKVMKPLFFSRSDKIMPFYLYVNVTTPETLRKVLSDPKKYAPSGVYIMRIHGTFVNFLDLSPEIQEDIIKRLDLKSTVC